MVGVRRLKTASKLFAKSCGLSILLWGEKSCEYSFCLPSIISESIIADSIEDVIPHLLNPDKDSPKTVIEISGRLFSDMETDQHSNFYVVDSVNNLVYGDREG